MGKYVKQETSEKQKPGVRSQKSEYKAENRFYRFCYLYSGS
jgi:hypothetical protein